MATEFDLEPNYFEIGSCGENATQPEPSEDVPSAQFATGEKTAPSQILIVHPSKLYRDCLKQVIEHELGLPVAQRPYLEANDQLIRSGSLKLLIVGADGPGSSSWADHMEKLSKLASETSLVVVGNTEEPQVVAELLSKGVRGYLPTSLDLEVWTHALRFIIAGGIFAPASCLLKLATSINSPTKPLSAQFVLTPKQRLVVEAIRQGKANKTIAYELKMCESTVKVHVRAIMKKLEVKNRTQVAYLANEWLQKTYCQAEEFL